MADNETKRRTPITDEGSISGMAALTDAAEFPSKESVPFQIQMLSRMLTADYMSRVHDDHLAPAQTYVLRELMIAGPLSQAELARRMEIGKASVGETLVRLESAGLVERTRLARDKRVMQIQLTARGRAIRSKLGEIAHDQVGMIRQMIGEDNAITLLELLALLTRRMKEAAVR